MITTGAESASGRGKPQDRGNPAAADGASPGARRLASIGAMGDAAPITKAGAGGSKTAPAPQQKAAQAFHFHNRTRPELNSNIVLDTGLDVGVMTI